MPEAVIYQHQARVHTVSFARPNALLPVLLANGEIKLLHWGRRQHENSELPLGGWAHLHAIHDGRWSMYQPKPVRLPIDKFMQTDFEGNVRWYEVTRGQWLQGLIAHENDEYRVYIVTIIPELLDICHDRWPRIVAR